MGTLQIFLCICLGHFIAAQSVMTYQDAAVSQEFAGFFENFRPFPFERNFDFIPYDTIFSSWQTQTPDFHMLAEFPPIFNVPGVHVSCDEFKLTVLVEKIANKLKLTREEIQLGNGCYSNSELPNHFVFTYRLDQCGTEHTIENGRMKLVNALHLNLKNPLPTLWQTPSTMHVFCIPKRAYEDPSFFISTHPANVKRFELKAMNSSWTGPAESNVYKRGQVINLQVSAKTRPDQQLFIQSCFVSASPEPQTRPRHTIIMNKGCTAPFGSPHPLIQFVASNKAEMLNFVLNTSYLSSELYVHCSVLISNRAVTFGCKSCNYNVLQSRWEELSGDVEVCACCSSKCKGLSVKTHPADAKAVVVTGPFIIVDQDDELSPPLPATEPQDPSSKPVPNSMQSDDAASPPQGVVAVSQDPDARRTLWLPGQVQGTKDSDIGSQSEDTLTAQLLPSDSISDEVPELQPSTTEQKSPLNPAPNKLEGQSSNDPTMLNLNLFTMLDGWPIPPQSDYAVIAEESQRKHRFGRSEKIGTEDAQVDVSLPAEMSVNYLMLIESPNPPEPAADAAAEEPQRKKCQSAEIEFNQIKDELADAAVMAEEGRRHVQPVIRSKVEFSKGKDGSQTLSYEEEVKQQERNGGRSGRDGIRRKQEPRLRGLRSTFLHLLRRMDKEE